MQSGDGSYYNLSEARAVVMILQAIMTPPGNPHHSRVVGVVVVDHMLLLPYLLLHLSLLWFITTAVITLLLLFVLQASKSQQPLPLRALPSSPPMTWA